MHPPSVQSVRPSWRYQHKHSNNSDDNATTTTTTTTENDMTLPYTNSITNNVKLTMMRVGNGHGSILQRPDDDDSGECGSSATAALVLPQTMPPSVARYPQTTRPKQKRKSRIYGNDYDGSSGSGSTTILGFYSFWGLLLLSLYFNFYFWFLHGHGTHFSSTHPHSALHAAAVRDAFLNNRQQPSSSSSSAALVALPPVITHNLTRELEALVDFSSPEMLLRTAWHSLIRQRSKKTPYRIVTNVVPRRKIKKHDYGDDDFSLATHATVTRLDRLLEEYRRWGGPVSAAVYISSEADIDIFLAFIHDKGRMLKDIAIHVLMEDLSFMSKQYPNNILRNLAMSQLETDYFVALDVDFVTNVNAHQKLRDLYQIYPNLTNVLKDKTLLVLPAFESVAYNVTTRNETGHEVIQRQVKTLDAPMDKHDLIDQYSANIVDPFHLKQFPPGHGPTRFPIWFENRTGPLYPITYHPRFEPYVLAYRHGLPKYWTGFRGYFFNKYSWFVEVDSMGYKFAVLRDFFVFHVGLSGGSTKIPLWKSREWQKFLRYVDRVHHNQTMVPLMVEENKVDPN